MSAPPLNLEAVLFGDTTDAFRRDALSASLPVLEALPYVNPPGRVFPLATIDVSSRPDVARLPHIVSAEGSGDVESRWQFLVAPESGSIAVLHVAHRRQPPITYSLCFDMERDRDALDVMAATGVLYLGLWRPDLKAPAGPVIGMTVDAPDLSAAMRAFRDVASRFVHASSD